MISFSWEFKGDPFKKGNVIMIESRINSILKVIESSSTFIIVQSEPASSNISTLTPLLG